MTIREQLGHKIGDKFKVIVENTANIGDIVTLEMDYGESSCWFSGGTKEIWNIDGLTCISFSFLEKLENIKKLKYIGCYEDQIRWGNNDDPRNVLEIDYVYEVESEEVHSWHTKIKLRGIQGKFNSACFEEV